MCKFISLFKRDLVNIVLNPMLLFYNTVFPMLMILALGFLNRGNYGNTGIDSYDYYGITILLYIVLNVSTSSANSFMEKSLKTTNMRVMFTPVRLSFIYLSKIAATFVFTSACFSVMMLLANKVLGVDYGGRNAGLVLCLVLLFNLFSSAAGVMMCCIFKSEEATNKILSLVNMLLALFGGLFFQLDGLGRAAAVISRVSPVKWVLDGILRIVYDGDTASFLPISAAFILLSLAMLMLCRLTFRTEDYV